VGDAVLLELEVQVGVGEPARAPVLPNDDLARLRLEVGVELPTPEAPGEVVPLLNLAL
jgi:hypothetical protein